MNRPDRHTPRARERASADAVDGARDLKRTPDSTDDALLRASEFLTTTEAADLLRVHRTTITRLVKEGKIAGTRIGSRLVIARSAIDEFVERNTTRARPEAFDPKVRVPRSVPTEREALRQRYEFLRPVSKAG